MHLVYLITAAVGCTVLAIQIVLQLLGLGADGADGGHFGELDHGGDLDHGDLDHGGLDHGGVGDLAEADHHVDGASQTNLFFGLLSFKTMTAFLAFFGLAGLAAEELGVTSALTRLALSLGAGLAAGILVMALMRLLVGLQSSGNVDAALAVGQTARVYLRVPASHAGAGKITVVLGGREVELQAVTGGREIATGATVEVVRRVDASTFEVVLL